MKYNYLIIITLLLLFSFCACSYEEIEEKDALAQVYNSKLYIDDIVKFMPEDTTEEDSILFINDFIDDWINHHLLYVAAIQNLRDTTIIVKKIHDYRQQLYIHNYLRQYLEDNVDFTVDNEEIIDYYNNNLQDFVLNETFVKAHYLTMSALAGTYYLERNMVMETEAGDHDKLLNFCDGTGRRVYFHDEWIKFSDFLNKINYQETYNVERLKFESLIENVDFNLRYLAKINDYKLKGDHAPIEIIENDIVDIIINKRKRDLTEQIKTELRLEAERNSYVSVKKISNLP